MGTETDKKATTKNIESEWFNQHIGKEIRVVFNVAGQKGPVALRGVLEGIDKYFIQVGGRLVGNANIIYLESAQQN